MYNSSTNIHLLVCMSTLHVILFDLFTCKWIQYKRAYLHFNENHREKNL